MNLLRNLGAVVLGCSTWLAILYMTNLLVPQATATEPFGTLDMIVTGARWVLGTLAAGMVTGGIAASSPRRYSLVVGGLAVMWIWVLVAYSDLDFFSPYFIFGTSALMLLAVILGATLARAFRSRRARLAA